MFIDKDIINLIQSTVPIEDVIHATGYTVFGTGKSKSVDSCPICKRDKTHIKINSDKNLFNCYSSSCNFKGNQFHWVMEVEGLKFTDAVLRVAEIGGISIDINKKDREFEKKQKALKEAINFYNTFDSKYLNNRGITEDIKNEFNCGYAPGGIELKRHMNSLGYNDKFLLDIGLIRELKNGNLVDTFYDSIIIPDIRNGVVYDIYSRSVDENKINKHIYLYGRRSFIGFDTIKKGSKLYIFEAPIDALSYKVMNNETSVISTGGATKFDNSYVYLIKKYNLKPVFCYDNDNGGIEGTIKAIELLNKNGIGSKVLKFDGNDMNDILRNNKAKTINEVEGKEFLYDYQLSNIPLDYILKYIEQRKSL